MKALVRLPFVLGSLALIFAGCATSGGDGPETVEPSEDNASAETDAPQDDNLASQDSSKAETTESADEGDLETNTSESDAIQKTAEALEKMAQEDAEQATAKPAEKAPSADKASAESSEAPKRATAKSEDSQDSSDESIRQASVKSKALVVRARPSGDAKVVDYLRHGAKVEMKKRVQNGWIRIGRDRYVHSNFLETDSPEVLGTGGRTAKVGSRALYIREKPDPEAPIVGVLLEGEKVNVTKTDKGWSQLDTGRFVRDRYLKDVAH